MNNEAAAKQKWEVAKKKIYVSIWEGGNSDSDMWLDLGTVLTGPVQVSDKCAFFLLSDGREVGVDHREPKGCLKKVKK